MCRFHFVISHFIRSGESGRRGGVDPGSKLRNAAVDWLQSRIDRSLGLHRRAASEILRLHAAIGVPFMESVWEEVHVSVVLVKCNHVFMVEP